MVRPRLGEGELARWMGRNEDVSDRDAEERAAANGEGGGSGSSVVTADGLAQGEWDLDKLARWFRDG